MLTPVGRVVTHYPSWQPLLARESARSYFAALRERVVADRALGPVYPPPDQVLAALQTPLRQREADRPPGGWEEVRCVVLGQDPYHGPGQAHGLAFSVPKGVRSPPSLMNVLSEMHDDMGRSVDHLPELKMTTATDGQFCGDLTPWARHGVLLLNTVLTVRRGEARSHAGIGWEQFTDAVCLEVLAQPRPVAWLLWGADARKKLERLTREKFYALGRQVVRSNSTGCHHLFLTAPHPSPLAQRGDAQFRGCHHFSTCNDWLASRGARPIDWRLS